MQGTDIVFMAQPYRAYAKTLLERQTYPGRRTVPGGTAERPYDVAGWTLPAQMGVKVVTIERGSWTGDTAKEFQDVVLLRRPDDPRPLIAEGVFPDIDRRNNVWRGL